MNMSSEHKIQIPFNLFFPNKVKAIDNSAFLKALYHNKVDEKIRSVSPLINGKKNPVFRHPNYMSQFEIGDRSVILNTNPNNLSYINNNNNTSLVIENKQVRDPRAFHVELNERRKQAISAKVNNREKLAHEAAKRLEIKNDTDKERLIKANEKKENSLNKYSLNPQLEKSKQRNKSMDLFMQNSEEYILKTNAEKDKYYRLYVNQYNPIPEKVNVISRVESKDKYRRIIEGQIAEKKVNSINEKRIEDKNVTVVNKILEINNEKEDNYRKLKQYKISREFSEGNKLLMKIKEDRKNNERQVLLKENIDIISKNKNEVGRSINYVQEKQVLEKIEFSKPIFRLFENRRSMVRKILNKSSLL